MSIGRSLAFRLFFFLLLISLLVFLPFIVLVLKEQRRNLEYQLLDNARQTNEMFMHTTRYSMLKNDRTAIDKTVISLKKMPELEVLRIYSKKGISFSTHKAEIGKKLDEKAQQCIVCHRGEPALETIPEDETLQIITGDEGRRALVRIDPIMNSRACGLTDCHPKPTEQKVLGILETQMSLDKIDQEVIASRNQLVLLSIGAITIIELLTAVFIWIFVHRRVRTLTESTLRVGAGDLDHRVQTWGKDELGELSRSFNEMVEKVKKMVELETSYRELQELDQMKDNLLHMVSHDLRTPMTGIMGYAYILLDSLDQLDQATQKEYLSIMIQQGERLTRLIENLLDLQRFETKKMSFELESLDLIELVDKAIKPFKTESENKGISLNQELPAKKVFVLGNHDRLAQVMSNLMSNAVKFTPEGGNITVSAEEINGENGQRGIKVTVSDNGRGIAPERQPEIFSKYQQAYKELRAKEEGSGLGLALVREIIGYHGGRVGLVSAPDKGSAFHFILPIIPPGEEK